jgi:hypothetical protein
LYIPTQSVLAVAELNVTVMFSPGVYADLLVVIVDACINMNQKSKRPVTENLLIMRLFYE